MEKFRKMIQEIAKRQVPVQTRWVEVVSADKDAGTLIAKSLDTDLEYYDVQIGIALKQVPKAGCRALIGIVENKAAATFLIMATELEEVELTAEKILLKGEDTWLNGDQHGGLLIVQKLFDELDKEKARVDGIIQALNAGVPSTGTPDSGAALIASIKTALGSIVQKGNYGSSLVNDTVKHG